LWYICIAVGVEREREATERAAGWLNDRDVVQVMHHDGVSLGEIYSPLSSACCCVRSPRRHHYCSDPCSRVCFRAGEGGEGGEDEGLGRKRWVLQGLDSSPRRSPWSSAWKGWRGKGKREERIAEGEAGERQARMKR
jgi:hypothetical protein